MSYTENAEGIKLHVVYVRKSFFEREVLRRTFATKRAAFEYANNNLQLVEGICIERIDRESLWNEFRVEGIK